MKSCFNCRFCADVVEIQDDEKLFTCTVPLPPWRFRADETVSTLSRWCYDDRGHQPSRDIPSGDAMAEFCPYHEAKP